MSVIWKYPLRTIERQEVLIPEGAEILHFGVQYGVPTFWADVDMEADIVVRTITFVGTGHTIPPGAGRHLGTFLEQGGMFVWHLFIGEERDA